MYQCLYPIVLAVGTMFDNNIIDVNNELLNSRVLYENNYYLVKQISNLIICKIFFFVIKFNFNKKAIVRLILSFILLICEMSLLKNKTLSVNIEDK